MSASRSESVANKSGPRQVGRGPATARVESWPASASPTSVGRTSHGVSRTSRLSARRGRRGRPRRRGRRRARRREPPGRRTRRPPGGRACRRGRSGPSTSSRGQRRADQVDHARAGRRRGPRARSPAPTPRGVRRPTGASAPSGRPRAGRPGRAGPSTIASNRWRSTRRVEVLLGDLPRPRRRRRPAPRPGRRGPATRCSANSAATSASSPTRSRRDHRDPRRRRRPARPRSRPPPRAYLVGDRDLARSVVDRRRRRRRAARAGRAAARSRTSPARQVDQAFGDGRPGVGLGERAQQRRAPRRRPTRSATSADRRRVVGVAGGGGLGEQQVPAHEQADQRRPRRASKPIRVAIVAGERLAGDAVLGQPALADVVQQRGDHAARRAGATLPDQRGRLDAGLDDVPVDGEPVDRRGVRQQPDPLPLGQEPVAAPRSPRASPRPAAAPARGEQPDEQRRAPRPATGRAARRPRRPGAAAVAGASSTSRSAATAAARSSRVGSSPALGAGVEHDLAAGERDAGLDRLQLGLTGPSRRAPGPARNHEKVHRRDTVSMVAKESPPSL